MSVLRSLSALVISCFKGVERAADWLTGAAGPVFVALCWALIGLGGIAFFDVLIFNSPTPLRILLTPLCLLIASNLYGHYYLVTHIDPGHALLALQARGETSGTISGVSSSSAGVSGAREIIVDGKGREVEEFRGRWTRDWPRGVKRGDGPWKWNGGGPGGVRRRSASGREKLWEDPMTAGRRSSDLAFSTRNAEEHLGLLDGGHEHSTGDKGIRPSGFEDNGDDIAQDGRARQSSALNQKARKTRKCRKCQGPKPDVGLHNQRHFILFMASLTLACWILMALGWDAAWRSLGPSEQWAAITPSMPFTLIYILSVAIGFAVPVLLAWHVYLIANGETSIESHDNSYFGRKAKQQGKVYVNPWNVGARRNLELAFNVGPEGYPYRTLLFPLRIPSYTSGWHYPQHPLAEAQASGTDLPDNTVVGDDEGLTDDEEGGAGFWDGGGV